MLQNSILNAENSKFVSISATYFDSIMWGGEDGKSVGVGTCEKRVLRGNSKVALPYLFKQLTLSLSLSLARLPFLLMSGFL